ncbi:MAG: SMI1/KNR4 family protein [Maricaulaceae bacterium]
MNDFFNRMRAKLRRHTPNVAPTHEDANLSPLFNQIEAALKVNYPDAYASLIPGASEAELARLKDICFDGQDIPEDLSALYKWHNGQTGYGSINQEDNRTFLPIDEVIDAWEFLNDPMEDIDGPISKDWIPITHNGAGDYLVYVRRGEHTGGLISYWHDEADRYMRYSSLKEWLEAILTAAKTAKD